MLTIEKLERAIDDQEAIYRERGEGEGVSALLSADLDPAAAVVLGRKRARVYLRVLFDGLDADPSFESLARELAGALQAAWVDGAMTAARAMRDGDPPASD